MCDSYRLSIHDFATHLASALTSNKPMRGVIPVPPSWRIGDKFANAFYIGHRVTLFPRSQLVVEPSREDYADYKIRRGYVAALADCPDSGDSAPPFQATIVRKLFSASGKPRACTGILGSSPESMNGLPKLRYGRRSLRWKVPPCHDFFSLATQIQSWRPSLFSPHSPL